MWRTQSLPTGSEARAPGRLRRPAAGASARGCAQAVPSQGLRRATLWLREWPGLQALTLPAADRRPRDIPLYPVTLIPLPSCVPRHRPLRPPGSHSYSVGPTHPYPLRSFSHHLSSLAAQCSNLLPCSLLLHSAVLSYFEVFLKTHHNKYLVQGAFCLVPSELGPIGGADGRIRLQGPTGRRFQARPSRLGSGAQEETQRGRCPSPSFWLSLVKVNKFRKKLFWHVLFLCIHSFTLLPFAL